MISIKFEKTVYSDEKVIDITDVSSTRGFILHSMSECSLKSSGFTVPVHRDGEMKKFSNY